MAYDETFAERVRKLLRDEDGFREQKMFGGIAFMLHGNMCCGVRDEELILRLGYELARKALESGKASLFNATGRPINSFITIPQEKLKTPAKLKKWVKVALEFNRTLPPKVEK